jgi:hypothetical protein
VVCIFSEPFWRKEKMFLWCWAEGLWWSEKRGVLLCVLRGRIMDCTKNFCDEAQSLTWMIAVKISPDMFCLFPDKKQNHDWLNDLLEFCAVK